MTRVLLTGANGYIGEHVLKVLLEHGHSVLATVRSSAKADDIFQTQGTFPKDELDFAIVSDITEDHAFDDVLKSSDFEAVIHLASPSVFTIKDIKNDMLVPAVKGTVGILKSIKAHAPKVKRVVLCSSMVAVAKDFNVDRTFTDADWNDITEEEALRDTSAGYAASKTFAEKAAWQFMKDEAPAFSLATLAAVLVLGPIIHPIQSLDHVNSSSELVRDFLVGKFKDSIPDNWNHFWVDVRDTALAHVRAMENEAAGGRRFIISGGYYSNKEIGNILWSNFPELQDRLPGPDVHGCSSKDHGKSKFDATPSAEILGLEYVSLERSVVDMANSLLVVQKK